MDSRACFLHVNALRIGRLDPLLFRGGRGSMQREKAAEKEKFAVICNKKKAQQTVQE